MKTAIKYAIKEEQQEIVATRILEAPRMQVWEAYVEPEHVEKWWGLRNVETVSCRSDVRVGGIWRFVLRGADGQEYPFSGKFLEIAPYERLVYTDGYGEAEGPRPQSTVTVTFDDLPGGKTKLTKISVADPSAHETKAVWLKRLQGDA
jgi:uncharacterized protein YndB with AHSA1/START domain